MSNSAGAITHVSDTAILIAGCRAVETERSDALVRDPFASRLAGDRGIAMFRALPHPEVMGFGIAIRTRFIDELILEMVESAAVRTLVSVGAGLDTRPWRLDLPPDLKWIEIDLIAMLDYKDAVLGGEAPRCRRERLPADLNDPAQRARIYAAVGREPALMLTEGLLMYLPALTVHSLATETPRESGITRWITDVVTTTFHKAIGGGGKRVVGHVQAADHLTGEQILQTLDSHGWRTAVRRSYITDLAFASERIKKMKADAARPTTAPSFSPNDPSGVHLFLRS